MSGGHFSKVCSKCKQDVDSANFCKDAQKSDRLASVCRSCMSAKAKEMYRNNQEKEALRSKAYRENNKDKEVERVKKYREENKEKIKLSANKYYTKNKEKCIELSKLWASRNCDHVREQRNKYMREKREADISFRLSGAIRSSMSRRLKSKNKGKTIAILGCTVSFFMEYLESNFQMGMSWDNYGKDGWHIDHITPCVMFDLSKRENIEKCFHFSNTQPMWASDNHKKGGRYVGRPF